MIHVEVWFLHDDRMPPLTKANLIARKRDGHIQYTIAVYLMVGYDFTHLITDDKKRHSVDVRRVVMYSVHRHPHGVYLLEAFRHALTA